MREVALDTETTGLDPRAGHRVVEIGAVEMVDRLPTGRTFHVILDPERPIPPEASRIHGITDERVRGCPRFRDIVDDFLRFVDGAVLLIHNAPFDLGFLDAELERCGRPPLPRERVIDTLELSRRLFRWRSHSLDSLCRRFDVPLDERVLHGALLDARLLVEVWSRMMDAPPARSARRL